jgi:hypothetical protein
MHPITFFPSLSINVAPKCHFPFNFQIKILILEEHITRKFLHTSETWRLAITDYRFIFQISINQNLAEADVKFKLVKFCYIFFILYAINEILLKTVKNNIVACLCNVFYTNLSLWNTTIQYNTDILFPMGFTYDFYANRWRMCSISHYFRNSSASINNVTNVNYDIDLQKMYVFV